MIVVRVFAIIPAHNEEDGIEETVMSIIAQSYKVEKILIACDNCTDNTVNICAEISEKHSNVFYFETFNNHAKKAGALNQAFSRIKNQDWDLLLQMDADSVIEDNVVDEATKEFFSNSEIGGLSARYITKDYNGGSKILYVLQYLESCFVHSIQVERGMRTNVLSGAASFFRREALLPFGNEVWDELSIVEDYALTLELKQAGWTVRVGKKCMLRLTICIHGKNCGGREKDGCTEDSKS